ncbi:MAG: metal ABC transporter permease [Deferribacterales bacterium]
MELFKYDFFTNGILGILLSSFLFGIIGSIIVINKTVSMAGSIAHAAYGGVGLAFYLGLPVQITTMIFSAISGGIIARISEKAPHKIDSYTGIIWAFGMALGIILIDLTPGYNADMMTYLFGNILTITTSDLILTFIISIIVITFLAVYYNQILIISFDKDYAKILGYNIKSINFITYIIISLCIVILIRLTGIVMIMAMLTIPQNIALKHCKSFLSMIIFSTILVLILSYSGFYIAYKYDLTTGATIIIFSVFVYLLDAAYLYVKRK